MIASVTCTACRNVVEMPIAFGTSWCTCGKTYLTKHWQGHSWGGPGKPRTEEIERVDVTTDDDQMWTPASHAVDRHGKRRK